MLFRSLCLTLPLFSFTLGVWAQRPHLRDPRSSLERTIFQTARPYSPAIDLRSDVAVVYGIDPRLPDRIRTWRDRGYRIHVMTGVSWGNYQDYLYGRFDGTNHEDEAQTDRNGHKVGHGGDVYYMCPGQNYGKFLCIGVERALKAGAKAIHLEEPEFWVRSGYSEGFKREWRAFYHQDWVPPQSSVDAQWRASKLKYYLYRRALQQIFDFVQAWNRREGTDVRCYVPTHSLLNYAHWKIVSPESSLARVQGCDGYIAQVWTGTARTPNVYHGRLRERTFDTAFLEYGAMQNLVRATGRRVWYLNDPVEDNPHHDWNDYRNNWESTLTASLLHPEVWRYEVMPWPGRVFTGRYLVPGHPHQRETIPAAYATELQTVINALNQMHQEPVQWENGNPGVGVMISDSLMFERGPPQPSDPHMSHVYGLALPLLKHGIPVIPVQLENVTHAGYLRNLKLLLMTYQGMKPLSPDVHPPIARWVKAGGILVFWDDDTDPFLKVSEWWNRKPRHFRTPRQDLFERLGLAPDAPPGRYAVGRGVVYFQKENPVSLAQSSQGDRHLFEVIHRATQDTGFTWKESNHLLLRRGPFLIAAGLEESIEAPVTRLRGHFVDLFDPKLSLRREIEIRPGARLFLLDLDRVPAVPALLAAACKALPQPSGDHQFRCAVEGIADTQAVVLLRLPGAPKSVSLEDQKVSAFQYDRADRLLWVRFRNKAFRRELAVDY